MDPLFLQAKESSASVLEEFVGASEFENSGQRVVVGQRQMQAVSDIFLGWVRVDGRSGDRIAMAAYLGSGDAFDMAVQTFADAYADQNERDHQQLVQAIASGRISAKAGM
jgi:hypothetical protein